MDGPSGCQAQPHALAPSPPETLAAPRNRPTQPPRAARSGLHRLVLFSIPRPTVIVVSHERSGTHFLMNAIARGYGYVADPWIDFDHNQLAVNFFAPREVARTLAWFADQHAANVIKSHHAVDFFEPILGTLLSKMRILYIHRDPVAVMASFSRVINEWPWREGPKRDNVLDFARAEPEGQLLRYQMKQRANMLHRWAAHVEGWTKAARGQRNLRVVRYDSLRDDYAATLASLGDVLAAKPVDLTPPPRDVNVIGNRVAVGDAEVPGREALHALALAEVGDTMRALGYA
jgi:hypothetical protein